MTSNRDRLRLAGLIVAFLIFVMLRLGMAQSSPKDSQLPEVTIAHGQPVAPRLFHGDVRRLPAPALSSTQKRVFRRPRGPQALQKQPLPGANSAALELQVAPAVGPTCRLPR